MKKAKVTCRFKKGDMVIVMKDGKSFSGSVYTVNKETGNYLIYAPGSTFATGLIPASDANLTAA